MICPTSGSSGDFPKDETLLQMLASPKIVSESHVDTVWVANRVTFEIHTVGNRQYVAYYDQDRNMSVASRVLGRDEWDKTILPSVLMWDSHNYVEMGIDPAGYIHVSGNMHTHPLVYFRSARPHDITEMIPLHRMVGRDERNTTYPKFFYTRSGDMLFSYRSGTCGNGNILVNRFDPETREWSRYLDVPLFEGINEKDDRAAYHRFIKDGEGNFHFIWIWRWTPLVETSHQICYATTPDLKNWKNAAGEPVSLPFLPDDPGVMVDDTPSGGGMHNGRYKIALTAEGEPVIGYVKYDEDGLTQLYLARHNGSAWVSRKISDWDFRWEFFGGGDKMTIGANFDFRGLSEEGYLVLSWKTQTGDSGHFIVDPENLSRVPGKARFRPQWPADIMDPLTSRSGFVVDVLPHRQHGSGSGRDYALKWETPGVRLHGKHAPEVIPTGPCSPLVVVGYE